MTTDLGAAHDDLRPLMFSIAYRMLGSVAEAEDVVQDAFVKMHQSVLDGTVIDSPDAFATTVTTRLAIDALRSARHRREQYVGPWLPEPLVETSTADPAWRVELDETVSTGFLLVLDRLSPPERAVFLLREVFGYDYARIAGVLDTSEQNCRQILTRARRAIHTTRSRDESSPTQRATLAGAFLDALRDGDVARLERLLADDVVLYADGGGKAPAIRTPMHGSTPVVRFLLGLFRQTDRVGIGLETTVVNGQPGVRAVDADGATVGVVALGIANGRIHTITNQINPDKLRHLGRVGDLTALLRRPR